MPSGIGPEIREDLLGGGGQRQLGLPQRFRIGQRGVCHERRVGEGFLMGIKRIRELGVLIVHSVLDLHRFPLFCID